MELNPNDEMTHSHLSKILLVEDDPDGAEVDSKAALPLYNAQYHGGVPSDSRHSET